MSALICVTGSKGSPGATTFAAALAFTAGSDTTWVMLVDADPDGGDLAALLGVGTDPGLVSLAAASRHRFTPEEIGRHLQPVGPGVGLLAAPSAAEQSASALSSLGRPFADALSVCIDGSAVVADLGRWRPGTPAADLVRAASVTVLVLHPSVAGVAHARSVLADLQSRAMRVVVAVHGDRPYGPDEVAAALRVESVLVVPVDRSGAAALAGGGGNRWLRRAPLARVARSLVNTLGSEVPPDVDRVEVLA